jgi:hypothetical protein
VEIKTYGERLFVVEGPIVSFYGAPYPTRMCVAKLEDGGLWIHSPIAVNAQLKQEVDSWGRVACIVSPNKIHHLAMGEWASAYPDAEMWASPGLAAKRRDLRFRNELGDEAPARWAREIDQLIFRGSSVMDEVVFFHRQSRVLIVADLIENFPPDAIPWWMKPIAHMAGIVAPNGQAPIDFRLSFRDKEAARDCLRRILAWEPAHVIMAHGTPLEGIAALRHAFRWLGLNEH